MNQLLGYEQRPVRNYKEVYNYLRRYLPNKPHKWGLKIFSRNGASGQCYDFDLNGAPDPNRTDNIDSVGYFGADIVLKLCAHIPENKGYKLYFDNYFTFIELLLKLK